jgi:hypothetical protein
VSSAVKISLSAATTFAPALTAIVPLPRMWGPVT